MGLRTLKTKNLGEMVQEQIKRYIIEKGREAGHPLPTENELSKRFGISRTAVREALRGLEAVGMIETRHGVGRFIRNFNFEAILNNLPYSLERDIKNFKDILEIRVCLESNFLEKNIDQFTDSDITEIRGILSKLEKQVLHHSPERDLIETHTEFHVALYRHLKNDLLVNLIRIFSTIQRNLSLLHRYRTRNRKKFIEEHRNILDALIKKNPKLARERMIEHFSEPIRWVMAQESRQGKGGGRA